MTTSISGTPTLKNYLLAIKLRSPLTYGKSELHIPFFALDKRDAMEKATAVVTIWDTDVDVARLFKLDEVQDWNP